MIPMEVIDVAALSCRYEVWLGVKGVKQAGMNTSRGCSWIGAIREIGLSISIIARKGCKRSSEGNVGDSEVIDPDTR